MRRRDAAASGSDGSSIIPPLEKVWEFQARKKIEFFGDKFDKSALAVAYSTIFFGSKDKQLYAVDALTGQSCWTFQMEKDVATTPIVSDGIVYVASKNKHLYALDAKTSEIRWQHSIGHDISATPTMGHGLVFFGSGDKHIYALDAQTGQQQWAFNNDTKGHISPIIAEGKVLAIGKGQTLLALNARNGELVWEQKVKVFSNPVVVGDVIILRTDAGGLEAVSLKEGTQLLKMTKNGTRDINVNKGMLFVTWMFEPKGVYGYNVTRTKPDRSWPGMLLSWDLAYRVDRGDISTPAVGGDFAFMSWLNSKWLFGINVAKVMNRWGIQLDVSLKAPPVISNGMLYVACDKGKVLAFKGSSDPHTIRTLEPRPDKHYVAPEPTYLAVLPHGTILWPQQCCLCEGPATETEKISLTEGDTRLELPGVNYCALCKQKVSKRFGRGEKPGVTIVKVKPPVLAFRSENYWVKFMEANRLR